MRRDSRASGWYGPQPPSHVTQSFPPVPTRALSQKHSNTLLDRPNIPFYLAICSWIVGGNQAVLDAVGSQVGTELAKVLPALISANLSRYPIPAHHLPMKPLCNAMGGECWHRSSLNPLGEGIHCQDDISGSVRRWWGEVDSRIQAPYPKWCSALLSCMDIWGWTEPSHFFLSRKAFVCH